jgi:integrase
MQEKQTLLYGLLEKGKEIIKQNPFIDHDAFGYELTNAGSFKSPLALMESYSKELKREGKVGTAEFYRQAISSFTAFAGEHFTFGSVTPKWLMTYEKDMIKAGKSITTVGMYCRALRTIFNLAINKKKVNPGQYPFGKGKYVIPTSKGRKLALTEDQKNKVLAYPTLDPIVRKAVDLWIFSYFCYGMNFADIARLKFSDIKDNNIFFDRTKTINTGREHSLIEIPLRKEVIEIIKKWGSASQSSYIFPVLRDGLTPEQINNRVHDFIADTNAGLKTACADKNLQLPRITTYWARHTFATIAYKKGAGIEFIQKALGHADVKTTQVYINSFDMETKRKYSNLL